VGGNTSDTNRVATANAPPTACDAQVRCITGTSIKEDGGPTIVDDIELIRDRNVVAVIAFRESSIYASDASQGEHPEHVVATDPRGRFHKVHHQAGNPKGTYADDSPEYWEALAEALSPAGAILLLGHGKGKANASHHWVAYVEKHRKDVAAKIVADVRVDIDHLTEEQVLRLARHYFAGPSE
jgi:hypothetical protein